MRFTVSHVTHYRYSAPVRLAPHRLRLAPRPGLVQDLRFALSVWPEPVARQEERDAWGNRVIALDFAPAETTELRVESRFTLTTATPGPAPAALAALPWPPDPALADYLAAPDPGPEVRAFAATLAAEAQDPLAFLDALNQTLFSRTDRHIRPSGYARAPAETLALRSGACRDLTELFLAAARLQGIPARFASGYQARSESPDGQRHLHAWPEVFLPGQGPGTGWRGYDPTHGLPVTDGHVALAVAPGQGGTMSVEGGFWGPPVTSDLDYAIHIEAA